MLQLSLETGLTHEARSQIGLLRAARLQKLGCDLATDPAVAKKLNLSHPPACENFERVVALVELFLVEELVAAVGPSRIRHFEDRFTDGGVR